MKKTTVFQFVAQGRTLTLDFGWYCWELFCEKMNVSPSRITEVFTGPHTLKAIRCLIVCGVEANAYLRDLPKSITEADVTKMINDSPELMGEILNTAAGAFITLNQKISESGDKTTLTENQQEV